MKMYPGTSFWDVYNMSVPFRKWLIDEHIRQTNKQEQNQQPGRQFIPKQAYTPLTTGEKKIISNQRFKIIHSRQIITDD